MDNKINGRTPEEIKRGLECCNTFNACSSCPYEHIVDTEHGWGCVVIRNADTLALIQQLERERDEARNDLDTISYANTELHSAYEAMKRERDAAVAEIESLNAEIDAINEDYLSGIHTVREDAQPKWISVKERMPEDDLPEDSDVKAIKVFVAIKAKNGITIRTQLRHRRVLYDTRGEPFFDWEWRHSAGNVTHWMPLPEPPKEG